MPRYKLTLEYDGSSFAGWQRQDGQPSVQAVVEMAAGRLEGTAVTVYAAGRTDVGVHASGQVAHLDFTKARPAETIRDALNFYLNKAPVVVVVAEAVPDDFHARFSAIRRHYRYRIFNRRSRTVLDCGRVWHVGHPLDADAMAEAASILVGHHDFTSFRATQCQAKSPVKTLDRLTVVRRGDEIVVEASARSFLHNQIRITVGTLRLVGGGNWSVHDIARALEARDRVAAGPTAPSEGLTLIGVDYPSFRA